MRSFLFSRVVTTPTPPKIDPCIPPVGVQSRSRKNPEVEGRKKEGQQVGKDAGEMVGGFEE